MYQFEKPGETGTPFINNAVDMGDSYKKDTPPSTVYKPYPFEEPGE